MHVLHVITGLHRGGAETALYRLVAHTPHIRHEIISISSPGWYSSRLEERGIRVHHLNSHSTIAGITRLRSLIRKSDCDVVQAWMYRPNLFAGIFARLSGKPIVWNIRCSSLEPLGPASRFLVYVGGFVARWVPDFVINCSEKSSALHSRWGYGAAEGAVIPNGYDPAVFQPDDEARDRARASLGIPPGQFCIGSVARWHPQKGFPVLLEAAGILRRRIEFTLVIAGNELDSENRELAALVQENGCDDVVKLLGSRADVADLYRALDLHVLASVGSEGFPNVVAESMLSGTPNVATDIGDAAMIVGDCGWVVPPKDAEALATAIEAAFREWSSAGARWKERRKSGRSRITDHFSLDRMAQAYEAVWAKVAAAKAHGSAANR